MRTLPNLLAEHGAMFDVNDEIIAIIEDARDNLIPTEMGFT
jgi:hypothetical protein